jgi:hypothetical protein
MAGDSRACQSWEGKMDTPMNRDHLGSVALLLGLAMLAAPTPSEAAPPSAQAGCGPTPSVVVNPPEMVRVDGPLQSIELEIRQDGDRLCFVDRARRDQPAGAPTIRLRPGETLQVRLFNGITNPLPLRDISSPGHPTDFPGVAETPGDFEVRPGSYHEPTGNTNLHFHGLEVKPGPCGPATAPSDDVVFTYFVPAGTRPVPSSACEQAYKVTIPHDQPPGLYWYHTHFHGESEAQTQLDLPPFNWTDHCWKIPV